MKFTEEVITNLAKNEVFVFGSNENGRHFAGAALTAYQQFGAKIGQGFGLQGCSFAVPTKTWDIKDLDLKYIGFYVDRFLEFTKLHPELTFYVTKLGMGLRGLSVRDIAPLFNKVYFDIGLASNVILPKEFWQWVGNADGMS